MGIEHLKYDYYMNIKTRKVEWLWYPYIAYGKITLIVGDPGNGKSTLAINLASLVSNGESMPFCREPVKMSKVVYQNSEDAKEDTICPRLKSSGAQLGNVAYIDESLETLAMDDDRIDKVLEETGARLMVLDPYQAYFGNNADMYRASDSRLILGKLSRLAQKRKCAIILVGHMTKSHGISELYRSLGSIDIPAIARSVLLVSKMPTGDSDRLFTQIKNNLGPIGPSLLFKIMANGRIKWSGETSLTPESVLENNFDEPKTKVDKTCMLLARLLNKGTLLATEIEGIAKIEKIAPRTLYDAKQRLNIKSVRKNGKWYWSLENDR